MLINKSRIIIIIFSSLLILFTGVYLGVFFTKSEQISSQNKLLDENNMDNEYKVESDNIEDNAVEYNDIPEILKDRDEANTVPGKDNVHRHILFVKDQNEFDELYGQSNNNQSNTNSGYLSDEFTYGIFKSTTWIPEGYSAVMFEQSEGGIFAPTPVERMVSQRFKQLLDEATTQDMYDEWAYMNKKDRDLQICAILTYEAKDSGDRLKVSILQEYEDYLINRTKQAIEAQGKAIDAQKRVIEELGGKYSAPNYSLD